MLSIHTFVKTKCLVLLVFACANTCQAILGPQRIWIGGSSIVKRAGLAARDRIGGATSTCPIQLFGLLPNLKHLRTLQNDPKFIIVLCGANSLGLVKFESLLEQL